MVSCLIAVQAKASGYEFHQIVLTKLCGNLRATRSDRTVLERSRQIIERGSGWRRGRRICSLEINMKLTKSSRHSKITGDFGEAIVLYLLSRHGFECARVDHTGIDLIARRPDSKEVLGISVKSRSRQTGTENSHLALPHEGFVKAKAACDAFGCTPYIALVVDAGERIRVFLL